MTYYETLGVTSDASAVAIKNAYRSLAMRLHPDRNLDSDTTHEFQALQEAFAVLNDPELRVSYDFGGCAIGIVLSSQERPTRPAEFTVESLLEYASDAFDSFGYFASLQFVHHPDRLRGATEMLEEIDWFEEQGLVLSSPELYAVAASALDMYATAYCHTSLGEDKAPPLVRAVKLFETAIDLASNKHEFEFALAGLLVRRPQIRDLKRARALLEEVDLPVYISQIKTLLETIARWEGNLSFSPRRLAELDLETLSEMFEERKNCRALIKRFKKEKNLEAMRPILEHLYGIAVLCEACDAIMINIVFPQRPKHIEHLKRQIPEIEQMSFGSHGFVKSYLSEGRILSAADYKNFVAVYGATEMEFDPVNLLDTDLQASIAAKRAVS